MEVVCSVTLSYISGSAWLCSFLVVGAFVEDAGRGDCDLTVKADVAEHLGSVSYVYAKAGKDELIIEREASRHRADGDRITVSIKADRSLLLDSAGARIR